MYMAPERLLRVTADEVRCDIYSMGVTIFEALTLERPFQVPDHVTLPSLAAYLSAHRRVARARSGPGFPAEHEAVILKAMARDPAHRYESARQLAAGPRTDRHPMDLPTPPHPARRAALAAPFAARIASPDAAHRLPARIARAAAENSES